MWKKVGRWKLRCNRRLTFSLWGKIGKWDTVSGVGTNVGEKVGRKNLENIGFFSENFVSGMGWKRRGGLSWTCADLLGPFWTDFYGKNAYKNLPGILGNPCI